MRGKLKTRFQNKKPTRDIEEEDETDYSNLKDNDFIEKKKQFNRVKKKKIVNLDEKYAGLQDIRLDEDKKLYIQCLEELSDLAEQAFINKDKKTTLDCLQNIMDLSSAIPDFVIMKKSLNLLASWHLIHKMTNQAINYFEQLNTVSCEDGDVLTQMHALK